MGQLAQWDANLWYYEQVAWSQTATHYTMPSPGGSITKIGCKMAGWIGSPLVRLHVWDSDGNVIAYSGTFRPNGVYPGTTNLPWYESGSGGVGGLNTNPFVSGGTGFYIGFWDDGGTIATYNHPADGSTWHGNGGDRTAFYSDGQVGAGVVGKMTSYVNYTEGGVLHIRRGGVWKNLLCKIRRNGVWKTFLPKVRRSGVWKNAI